MKKKYKVAPELANIKNRGAQRPEGKMTLEEALHPPVTLLISLGSALVHAQEFFSPTGHPVDKHTFDSIMTKDQALREWIEVMTENALLPLKR